MGSGPGVERKRRQSGSPLTEIAQAEAFERIGALAAAGLLRVELATVRSRSAQLRTTSAFTPGHRGGREVTARIWSDLPPEDLVTAASVFVAVPTQMTSSRPTDDRSASESTHLHASHLARVNHGPRGGAARQL